MQLSRLTILSCVVVNSIAAPTAVNLTYALKETHPAPKAWSNKGPAPRDRTLDIHIGLTQQSQDILEQHALEVSDPHHHRYGQHLSAAEVHSLIAPTRETVALVQDWLSRHGINDLIITPAADWIQINVTVAQAEQLFHAAYCVFEHLDGTALIRATEWSLPAYLHEHIEVVQPTTSFFHQGKQSTDAVRPHTHNGYSHMISRRKVDEHPNLFHQSSGTLRPSVGEICDASFVTLKCLRTFYGTIDYEPQVPELSSIAVTNFASETLNRSDLHLYLERFRPEAAQYAYNFPIIRVNNGTDIQYNRSDGGGIEGDLDGDLVIGISYPIKFHTYNIGGQPPFNHDLATTADTNEPYVSWMNYILAQQELPHVISISYTDDEQSVPVSYAVRACNGFKQLAARGVSVLVSSGDNGVGPQGACYSNKDDRTYMFLPAFPASCPWVTSVGATANFTPEVAVSRFGSGGGFSNYFVQPAYQKRTIGRYLNIIGDLYTGNYDPNGRGYPVMGFIILPLDNCH